MRQVTYSCCGGVFRLSVSTTEASCGMTLLSCSEEGHHHRGHIIATGPLGAVVDGPMMLALWSCSSSGGSLLERRPQRNGRRFVGHVIPPQRPLPPAPRTTATPPPTFGVRKGRHVPSDTIVHFSSSVMHAATAPVREFLGNDSPACACLAKFFFSFVVLLFLSSLTQRASATWATVLGWLIERPRVL